MKFGISKKNMDYELVLKDQMIYPMTKIQPKAGNRKAKPKNIIKPIVSFCNILKL